MCVGSTTKAWIIAFILLRFGPCAPVSFTCMHNMHQANTVRRFKVGQLFCEKVCFVKAMRYCKTDHSMLGVPGKMGCFHTTLLVFDML